MAKAAKQQLEMQKKPEKPEERDNASAMLRALDLLGEIARSETPLGVPELCVRLLQQPRDYDLICYADPRSLRAAA